MNIIDILLPITAYLYGSVPFGFLMAKWVKGVDIRDVGSGNIGATNAARALGFKFFPIVFLLDFSKGLLPPLAASLLISSQTEFSPHPLAAGAAVAAILGHVFPIYLKFKGGKAVATGTGACLFLAHWAVLIAAGVWAVVFLIWRYVSLASICAAIALGVSVWFVFPHALEAGIFRSIFCGGAGIFVIILHHGNIRRLISGTEHKIGHKKPKTEES